MEAPAKMPTPPAVVVQPGRRRGLSLSRSTQSARRLASLVGQGILLLVTSLSTFAVLFIFIYIARDALPFFRLRGFAEFFTGMEWYPSHSPPHFGALSIFFGTGIITLGAVLFAVPLGIAAAVCLSDVLPFHMRQVVKPVVEMLAAIPSVAYGFFALVVLAPILQSSGGRLLEIVF
jgi:phosphate transport system permease protein